MFVIAKAVKDKEFMYKASTAHKVSKNSAGKIVDILNNNNNNNNNRYDLKEGEIWHVYEVGQYDNAYWYAENQRFYFNKGVLKERR